MSSRTRGKGRRAQAARNGESVAVSPRESSTGVEESEVPSSMSDLFTVNDDDAPRDVDRVEPSSSVRLHVMVKEPPKLTKVASENLDDVLTWKASWEQYFSEVKRVDVARATVDPAVLKFWNLLLSSGPDSPPLKENELARTPALDFMEMLVAYLKPLAKTSGSEGLDVLTRLKDKAKLQISFGKDEAYPGWSKVIAGIRDCLVKVGSGISNFENVADNVEMYNAFLDMFSDLRFRMQLKNLGKQNGCGNNVYKMWRLANKILYDAGVAETTLSVGHEILIHTLVQRGGRRDFGISGGAPAPKSKDNAVPEGAVGAVKNNRKCWSCGSDEIGHDWRACSVRTDRTDAEKAAGAAAKKAVRMRKNPK